MRQMDTEQTSEIRREIFDLAQELHSRGHTRRDIVFWLREVADYTEDYWKDSESYNRAPHEKDVVLPGGPSE